MPDKCNDVSGAGVNDLELKSNFRTRERTEIREEEKRVNVTRELNYRIARRDSVCMCVYLVCFSFLTLSLRVDGDSRDEC